MRADLKKQRFTDEEKQRWAVMFHETWHAIGPDADALCVGRSRVPQIVEFVCDANRVQDHGGMTDEEYAFLSAIYRLPRFQRWARRQLNY